MGYKVKDEFGNMRLCGSWRAKITDIESANELGRVRLQIPDALGDVESNWAYPKFPYAGFKFFPEISQGDFVYAEFFDGDPDKPVWYDAWYPAPDGIPRAPNLAKGDVSSTFAFQKGGFELETHIEDQSVREPPPKAEPQYGFNTVLVSQGGHVVEIDSTPGAERFHWMHPSGAYREVGPSGTIVDKSRDNRFELTEGMKQEGVAASNYKVIGGKDIRTVGMSRDVSVELNDKLTVGQDYIRNVDGSVVETCIERDETVNGNLKQSCSSRELSVFNSGKYAYGGNNTVFVGGTSDEVVTNAQGLPTDNSKTVTIIQGSYNDELTLGDRTVEITVGKFGVAVIAPDALGDAIDIEALSGNMTVRTLSGTATIGALTGTTFVTGTITEITSPTILLGTGASQPAVLGTALLEEILTNIITPYLTHTHTGAFPGPTSVPLTPMFELTPAVLSVGTFIK